MAYEKTFSLVVRIASIHLILAIVAHMDLELHKMDVKTAFLNGELNKGIFMEQLAGFIIPSQDHKVCKLNHLIYGLKQSSRKWYLRFHGCVELWPLTHKHGTPYPPTHPSHIYQASTRGRSINI